MKQPITYRTAHEGFRHETARCQATHEASRHETDQLEQPIMYDTAHHEKNIYTNSIMEQAITYKASH